MTLVVFTTHAQQRLAERLPDHEDTIAAVVLEYWQEKRLTRRCPAWATRMNPNQKGDNNGVRYARFDIDDQQVVVAVSESPSKRTLRIVTILVRRNGERGTGTTSERRRQSKGFIEKQRNRQSRMERSV